MIKTNIFEMEIIKKQLIKMIFKFINTLEIFFFLEKFKVKWSLDLHMINDLLAPNPIVQMNDTNCIILK